MSLQDGMICCVLTVRFDPVSKQMVDLFRLSGGLIIRIRLKESDLVFPVPLREKELNPLLGEDVVR